MYLSPDKCVASVNTRLRIRLLPHTTRTINFAAELFINDYHIDSESVFVCEFNEIVPT